MIRTTPLQVVEHCREWIFQLSPFQQVAYIETMQKRQLLISIIQFRVTITDNRFVC